MACFSRLGSQLAAVAAAPRIRRCKEVQEKLLEDHALWEEAWTTLLQRHARLRSSITKEDFFVGTYAQAHGYSLRGLQHTCSTQ